MVYPRTEMSEILEITNCGNREKAASTFNLKQQKRNSQSRTTLNYNHRGY